MGLRKDFDGICFLEINGIYWDCIRNGILQWGLEAWDL